MRPELSTLTKVECSIIIGGASTWRFKYSEIESSAKARCRHSEPSLESVLGTDWSNWPMGWASAYIEKLRGGEPVSFRPRGHPMSEKSSPDNCARSSPPT